MSIVLLIAWEKACNFEVSALCVGIHSYAIMTSEWTDQDDLRITQDTYNKASDN